MSQKITIELPNNMGDLKIPLAFILWAIVFFIAVIAAFSMIYQIEAESQGVVLRFGRYSKTVEPGLRFKLPFGIDTVYDVPIRRQLKQEFGFATPGATDDAQYSALPSDQEQERSMVTGDLNAATLEWVVQYRVREPRSYLFNVREPALTLRDISESVMRTLVGDRTVDEVITIGRQEIEVQALLAMQELSDKYELGLSVDQVQLKNVNPPKPVQGSFNEVNQAQQEKEKSINVANGDYNREVPRARGEAEQKIQSAEGYALKRVNEAEGDVARFNAVLKAYDRAPQVTRRRIYLETMREVVPKLGRKIIIDDQANQILPLLQMQTDNNQGRSQ